MRPKYDRISDSYGLSYQIIQSKLGYQTSLFSVSRHFSPAVWHESQVCYHSATQSSQFDVSFPKKLLKFVATRGKIVSLKFTKYRLVAGLRPDPLGELKRSPRPPSRNRGGATSKGRGREERGRWREGRWEGEGKGKGGGNLLQGW